MTSTTKAIIWAIAILTFALLSRLGVIASDAATTMIVILPVLAWLTLSTRGCTSRSQERRA